MKPHACCHVAPVALQHSRRFPHAPLLRAGLRVGAPERAALGVQCDLRQPRVGVLPACVGSDAAFASAVACLPQSLGTNSIQLRDFFGWPLAFETMLAIAFNSYGGNNYEEIAVADESLLKWFVMAFAACRHVYLMNLMVAQLCQRNATTTSSMTRGAMHH